MSPEDMHRQERLRDFEERAAAVRGPLKELWLSVAAERCETRLQLSSGTELSREMSVWLPERQAAAIQLLSYQQTVVQVDLSGLGMSDVAAFAVAEMIQRNETIGVLNLEVSAGVPGSRRD